MLQGKTIALGVTGSIACYKAADLASKLAQAGASVEVILTRSAQEFVSPLIFRSLTHRPVVTDLFAEDSEMAVEHVALAKRVDVIVIAPATANIIAKLAHGLADDPLTCTVLASTAPLLIAPAMDGGMWEHPATQANVAVLTQRGVAFVGPDTGHLASGLVGTGRLVDTDTLLGAIRMALGRSGDLAKRRIVVTAGGTQEPIDPVRVITNRSSGKMGFAVAEAARDRGALVRLIAAPTWLRRPYGVQVEEVRTAEEMRQAVLAAMEDADALIMAAAVADYRVANAAPHKMKKSGNGLDLKLVPTADILSEVKGGVVKVGFAAESERLVEHARDKLRRKGLHLIVANDITQKDAGFATDTNRVVILDRDGGEEALPLLTKERVAHRILDRVVKLMAKG